MYFKKFACLGLTGIMAASVLTGCGVNKNAVVATYGDREITAGILNFMCRLQQATYDDAFRSYVGEKWWESDLMGDGSTYEEDIKTNALSTLHNYYTLEDHMADYGVELTDEQKAAITDAATAFMEDNSKDALNEIGATQEIVEEYLTLITESDLMWDAIVADADTNVTDEEANERAYSYVQIGITTYTDSDGNSVEYTEDEISQMELQAQTMVSIIESGESDFETVATDYGLTVSTATYAQDDSIDEDLKTLLDSMAAGDPAQMVVTDSYIYIAEITAETDEEATETHRQEIIDERQDTLYNDTLAAWQEDDGWTIKEKVLAKITFDDYFTTVTESTEEVETTEQ